VRASARLAKAIDTLALPFAWPLVLAFGVLPLCPKTDRPDHHRGNTMQLKYRLSAIAIAALALASQSAYARQSELQRYEVLDAVSGDIPAAQHRSNAIAGKTTPGLAGVTDADVGDSDSFGRNVKWLGLASMNVTLSNDCSDPSLGPGCQVLNPAGAVTSFHFEDLAHITLPANSAHSLLCYWLSPFLNITYDNPTASSVIGSLHYSPTLTIENPVLDDPSLIDPTTGLPFSGKLLTGMTSSERLDVPLPASTSFTQRTRDSAVCIAGFMSRRQLVETYGLTDAQAKEFFKQPTVVRMNIAGTSRFISDAELIFGFRIVGD
jgi:hypothetical protein